MLYPIFKLRKKEGGGDSQLFERQIDESTILSVKGDLGNVEYSLLKKIVILGYFNRNILLTDIRNKYKLSRNDFEATLLKLLNAQYSIKKFTININNIYSETPYQNLIKINNDGVSVSFSSDITDNYDLYKKTYMELEDFEKFIIKNSNYKNKNLVLRFYEIEKYKGLNFFDINSFNFYNYLPMEFISNFPLIKSRVAEAILFYNNIKIHFNNFLLGDKKNESTNSI